MGKGKGSWVLRESARQGSRRSRRWAVVSKVLCGIFGLGIGLGYRHLGSDAWQAVLLSLGMAAVAVYGGRWARMRGKVVTGLDDRAVVEYGVEFKALSDAEQKKLLRGYRVGTFVLGATVDERERESWREAYERAYAMLRPGLGIFALLYQVAWRWAPAGEWKMDLVDGSVWISWLMLLVVALPQIIRMWTEPDVEAVELRGLVGEREA